MSKRPPRYELVTDAPGSHHGIPCLAAADRRSWGSQVPFVAAVLVAVKYPADPAACNCGSRCACPQVSRLSVWRKSFTELAAQEYRDKVRRPGRAVFVVPMRPVP